MLSEDIGERYCLKNSAAITEMSVNENIETQFVWRMCTSTLIKMSCACFAPGKSTYKIVDFKKINYGRVKNDQNTRFNGNPNGSPNRIKCHLQHSLHNFLRKMPTKMWCNFFGKMSFNIFYAAFLRTAWILIRHCHFNFYIVSIRIKWYKQSSNSPAFCIVK